MLRETYGKVLAYIKNEKGTVYERPLLIKALEKLEADSERNYLINAPTGYGKTLISMSIALHEFHQNSKVIIAYPLRALIEEQVLKMKNMFDFHGISKDSVGARYMGSRESLYLVHPITLTTIDTLSLTAVGLSPEDINRVYSSMHGLWFSNLGHYLFSWSTVYTSSFLILDEVHLMYDSNKSLSFLRALIDMCKLTGVRMIFMTATFPKKFENVLSHKEVGVVGFSRDDDPEFYDERSSKKYSIELLYLKRDEKLSRIRDVLMKNNFNKALVLFNTVEDAVSFYKLINDGRKILIHSRFTEEDKKAKVRELKEMMNSGEKCVVVGTQSVEAGIDISSDLIITEISPPLSLVQRFGRFLRFDEKTGKAFVWVEEDVLDEGDSDLYKVYDKELVRRTLNYLSSNSDVNLHISYEDFINKVYLEDPNVDENLIKELRLILLDLLEPTQSAMELFLKMEGSFVREGSNFVVVSEDEQGSEVELSVSFNYLRRLRKEGLCDNCPENEHEALRRSLRGEKFRVRVKYSREVGLA